MTPDEAIKDLQARVDGEFSIEGEDDCADMKLGIEALKRHQVNRAKGRQDEYFLLPGETEP